MLEMQSMIDGAKEAGLAEVDEVSRSLLVGLSSRPDLDFRGICDAMPVGAYVLRNGRILYANASLAQLIGCAAAHLLGRPIEDFIAPDEQSAFAAQMQHAPAPGEAPLRVTTACLCDCGTRVDVEILQATVATPDEPTQVGVVIDVTTRKRSELAAVERLEFEQELSDLSASFVSLKPDEIQPQINKSLQRLVEFLGNDRSTLVEFGDDDSHVLVTHSYALPDCSPFPIGRLPTDALPWFINQFRSGQAVFIRNLPDELPPSAVKEREYCLKHGLKSNITLPLKGGGAVIGGLTFAFMRHPCRWPKEMMTRLQLIGEVFASALLRRREDLRLQATLAENERLHQQLEAENLYLREQAILKHHHHRIIGRSKAMMKVLSQAERVATTDAPVLLLGDTGTGKELLAQTIHELSGRKSRPMVVVNCASLPATLIESELFGREAGAYTGAASAQVGRFVLADRSTLFLDEIGEFPIELQAKLLRVLQDGRFERLGSPKTVSVDVRIIAATNRDLQRAIRDGEFRADLFHRLNVFPIQVPSLRERPDDIPELVWGFVESLGRRMGKSIKSIPRKAMHLLQQYSWPGNVRELSNVIERAMILATDDTLHLELPADTRSDKADATTLKECERERILRALNDTGWRIRGPHGAAEILQIKATTLEARMARLGIKRPKP